jgi:hypothetical protein
MSQIQQMSTREARRAPNCPVGGIHFFLFVQAGTSLRQRGWHKGADIQETGEWQMNLTVAIPAVAIAFGTAGVAQAQTGAQTSESGVIVQQVAPPATAIVKVAPGTFVVTPVPGIATATQVRVQNFGDYDKNGDGAYSPMEFAQAMYFLATSDPLPGNPRLPASDRYLHAGAVNPIAPDAAVALLNATADEFAAIDRNYDAKITPAEMRASAML